MSNFEQAQDGNSSSQAFKSPGRLGLGRRRCGRSKSWRTRPARSSAECRCRCPEAEVSSRDRSLYKFAETKF